MRSTGRQRQNFRIMEGGQADWWAKTLAEVRRLLVGAKAEGLTEHEARHFLGTLWDVEKHGNISAAFVYLAREGLAFKSHRTRRRGKSYKAPAVIWVAEARWVRHDANPEQVTLL